MQIPSRKKKNNKKKTKTKQKQKHLKMHDALKRLQQSTLSSNNALLFVTFIT